MTGIQRINLKLVALYLGLKSKSAAERWCERNDVYCFMDGRTKYVVLPEFEAALDKDYIDHLKVKYPDKWQELYDATCKADTERINDLKSSDVTFYQRYLPKSDAAKRFTI